MKTKLIFSLLMLAVLTVNAQKKAIIKFDRLSNDYGSFKEEGGKKSTVFNFTNTGTDTLIVNEAKPSCGCITTDWTKTPVLPGGKGTVTVFYDPFRRPGKFEKSVWVHSNATEQEVSLTIKGEVIPKVKTLLDSFPERNGNLLMSSRYFLLRNTGNKEIKPDSMLVYNAGNKSMTFSFKDYPSYITCKAKPTTLAPKQKGKLCITYDAAKKNEYGMIFDTIILVTNDTINPNKLLQISATITDDFSKFTPTQKENAPKIVFTSEYIDYGTVKPGDLVNKSFEFKNDGKDTLIIRKATPYREDCKVTIDGPSALAKGESSKINIVFDTKGKNGEEGRTALLVTNDPNRSFIILVIRGKITP
jgi:hypothetical protein